MKRLRTNDADFEQAFAGLTSRTSFTDEIEAGVREMLASIRDNGDSLLPGIPLLGCSAGATA